jgi:hypothetical protein
VLLKSIGANIFRTFMTHNTTLLKWLCFSN